MTPQELKAIVNPEEVGSESELFVVFEGSAEYFAFVDDDGEWRPVFDGEGELYPDTFLYPDKVLYPYKAFRVLTLELEEVEV